MRLTLVLVRQVVDLKNSTTSQNGMLSEFFQSLSFFLGRQSNASQQSVSLYSGGWLYDSALVGHSFGPLGGGCLKIHAPLRGG